MRRSVAPLVLLVVLGWALPPGTHAYVLMQPGMTGLPPVAEADFLELRDPPTPQGVVAEYDIVNKSVNLLWEVAPGFDEGDWYEVLQDGQAIWNGTVNSLAVPVDSVILTVFQVVAHVQGSTSGVRYHWVVWGQGGEGSPLDPECPWFVLAVYTDLPLVGLVVNKGCVLPL